MRASILMAGCAADAAASGAIEERREEILQHFPSFFCVGPMRERPFLEELSLGREMLESTRLLKLYRGQEGSENLSTHSTEGGKERFPTHSTESNENQLPKYVPLGPGGVLKGLWVLGEELHSGMEVEIRQIPVRQETIEICEYLDLDPYYADSTGAVLIAAEDGHLLLEELKKQGIPAALIGTLNGERARIIKYPGHTRYLDKPRAYL